MQSQYGIVGEVEGDVSWEDLTIFCLFTGRNNGEAEEMVQRVRALALPGDQGSIPSTQLLARTPGTRDLKPSSDLHTCRQDTHNIE